MTRTGRRPGTSDTRDQILAVARRRFATRGYDATSLRGIATDAKVDPALLIHYFGTKEGLFTAATGLPTGLSEVVAGPLARPQRERRRHAQGIPGRRTAAGDRLPDRARERAAAGRPGCGPADGRRDAKARRPARSGRQRHPGRDRRAGRPRDRALPALDRPGRPVRCSCPLYPQ